MTDKEIADKVREAADGLNKAVLEALKAKLHVDLRVVESAMIPREYPIASVAVTVKRPV